MRIATACVLFPMLLAAAVPQANAQQALGRVGAACATLNAQNQFTFALTQSVPAGAVLVASIASRGAVNANLRITDPSGNTYVPVGAARERAGQATAVNQSARNAITLPAGASITVRMGQAQSAAPVCASLLAFVDLASGNGQLHSPGGKSATASTALALDLDRAGNGVPQALISTFALDANPGTVSASGSAQVQSTVCSAGNELCLVSAYDLSSATGTLGLSLAASNAVDWTGELTGLYRDSIFANRFE